jgi:hypothetical protein
VCQLVGAMERRTYEEGEKIVMKGEVVDTFYIIQSGEVQLEEERAIAKSVLGPGQFFGERSILQDTALDVSVISIGEKGTMCYCLDRQSFQDILGPIEDVWRWRALRGVHLLAPLSETQVMELVLALTVRVAARPLSIRSSVSIACLSSERAAVVGAGAAGAASGGGGGRLRVQKGGRGQLALHCGERLLPGAGSIRTYIPPRLLAVQDDGFLAVALLPTMSL